MTGCPHWYAPNAIRQAQQMAYQTNSMSWISWHPSFCDLTTGCWATGRNITNFHNSESCDNRIHHIDMLPLQLVGHSPCRPRPIWCSEPRHAIRLARHDLVVARQSKTSSISAFWKSTDIIVTPSLMGSSLPSHPRYSVLDLLNVLNLLVSSTVWSGPVAVVLHAQTSPISEFRIFR